ncbi:UPF0042 nucleotide-binding protein [Seinonella peptonophila]|uniref:UPF0042 nucleotide-binding protein n=1 Tax=Seinonella peptonophila TaxID=112248 RepID=A0A1M4XNH9_9BACL|nr:RNase adapter RapZ [Seinonella peptonophila]SHE94762.1 UPF0042 nucleotide-binding protein [Seinonella peptonophila]
MINREFNLVVITGMSGAGKTVAIQSLEDTGYFCIDNLPPLLLPKFAELLEQAEKGLQKVAIVVDLRGREFFDTLMDSLKSLEANAGIRHRILFLDADDLTLVRRYKETRRRHPLQFQGTLLERIQHERKLLLDVREKAEEVIDTSSLKPLELKRQVTALFSKDEPSSMSISFLSFGFKHGIPIDADLVFDVRFIPNPHYIDQLRPQTGKAIDVYEYVMKWQETQQFVHKLEDLFRFLFPYYKKEGKTQLVIAIGCTGGKHRSVALAEYFYRAFKEGEQTQVIHRDIEKGG